MNLGRNTLLRGARRTLATQTATCVCVEQKERGAGGGGGGGGGRGRNFICSVNIRSIFRSFRPGVRENLGIVFVQSIFPFR